LELGSLKKKQESTNKLTFKAIGLDLSLDELLGNQGCIESTIHVRVIIEASVGNHNEKHRQVSSNKKP